MLKTSFAKTAKKYLQNFLLTQLAITLVLLPVLSSWGIEISWMSLIGNLIFLPFLTAFLLVSSLVFVTQLCCLPNQFLIKILEIITLIWNKLLGIQHKSWLVSFPNHSTLLLLTITIATFIFFKSQRIKTFTHKLSLLTTSILTIIIILKLFAPGRTQLYSFDKKLFVQQNKNCTLDITDDGYFNTKMSPDKFVEFDLKPFLVSKFGTTKINRLILKKFSIRSFRAAIQCCKLLNLQKVILPYFDQEFNKKTFANFFAMKRLLAKNDVVLERKFSS